MNLSAAASSPDDPSRLRPAQRGGALFHEPLKG